jgi:hypothetical protein
VAYRNPPVTDYNPLAAYRSTPATYRNPPPQLRTPETQYRTPLQVVTKITLGFALPEPPKKELSFTELTPAASQP